MSQSMPPQRSRSVSPNQRPGPVTFEAMVPLLLCGPRAVTAILEFVHITWLLLSTTAVPGGALWIWGITDARFAVILAYAGLDLLAGGQFGRIVGLVFAILNAIRWFFYLPIAPIAALVIIGIDILMIYALVAHSGYFDSTRHLASPL